MGKRVILVILPVFLLAFLLIFSGCSWFNPLNRIGVGDYLIVDEDTGMNNPVWLGNEKLVAASGNDAGLVSVTEYSASAGTVIKEHNVTVTGTYKAGLISLSPDESTVTFHVVYNNDNADIVTMDLAADTVTTITDGNSEYHGSSFLSDTKLVYIEFDTSVSGKVTNRLIIHDLSSGTSTTLTEGTYDWDGTNALGDAIWWGRALQGSNKVLVCAKDYSAGTESFKVYDTTTGNLIFNGFDYGSWTEVTGGDWVDSNTIIIPAGSIGDYNYYIIDISTSGGTLVRKIVMNDPLISKLWGVKVSPDKTLVVSQYAEHDSSGNWVKNGLVVTRIAEAE